MLFKKKRTSVTIEFETDVGGSALTHILTHDHSVKQCPKCNYSGFTEVDESCHSDLSCANCAT